MPTAGARFPDFLTITVHTVADVDLSGVTEAEIAVQNPRGEALSWPWTVDAGETSVRITHTFSPRGTDATLAGDYAISGWLIAGASRFQIAQLVVPFERYP